MLSIRKAGPLGLDGSLWVTLPLCPGTPCLPFTTPAVPLPVCGYVSLCMCTCMWFKLPAGWAGLLP